MQSREAWYIHHSFLAETLAQGARKANVFIVVNASTIELPDVEKYIAATVAERPLILWNLELDTLRADLGMPFYRALACISVDRWSAQSWSQALADAHA